MAAARYVTRYADVGALVASLARPFHRGGAARVLLDASVLPNRADVEAAGTDRALADRLIAFGDGLAAAMAGGHSAPLVLPQVLGEAMAMLRSWRHIAPARESSQRLIAAWSAATGGARALDARLAKACVGALEALDRACGCSKQPGAGGRKTDLRLVAAAADAVWRRGTGAEICTRDEDVRRLTATAVRWWRALGDARFAAQRVRVWKLDRPRGRFRVYWDSRDLPARVRSPAGAAPLAAVGRRLLSAAASPSPAP